MNNQNTFYEPNFKYNREFAEKRLIDLGYTNFQFTGLSYSNGFSCYFELENGEEVRVSDHVLTGQRAFDVIQIQIEEPKKMTLSKKITERRIKDNDFQERINAAIAKNSK